MDTSELPPYDDGGGSPTQVNEGRSYDRYNDPTSLPTQEAGNDFLDRSLDENESGAVKFGSIRSMELDFESPTTDHVDGRGRNNGLSRFFPNSDNDQPATTTLAIDFGLETPAQPKNPFSGKFQTPLVAGSQLFAATPFSAAFNQVSPTSSRPSPSGLIHQPAATTTTTPHTGLSSPTKLRFSNLGDQTPMPAVLFHTLSTSSTSRFDGNTPYPNKAAGSPTKGAPQSSPTTRRRRAPVPITEYESMRKSQERREAAEARPERAGGYASSSSDDESDDVRRQRIVRQKKEAATRILATVSMSGPTFRGDIVEVPASVKKDARPRSQGGRQSSPRGLAVYPESDPPVPKAPLTSDTAAKAATAAPSPPGLRSSEAYDDTSFPQSLIDRPTPEILPATKTPSSSAALPEFPLAGQNATGLHLKSSLNETDAIPETSPAGKWPVAVSASGQTASREIVLLTSDAAEAAVVPASSMPEPALPYQKQGMSSSPAYEQRDKRHEEAEEVVSLLKQAARHDLKAELATSSPPVPTIPVRSNRPPQRKKARYETENEGRSSGRSSGRASLAASVSSMDRSTSSLSDLSVTPTQVSREGTPITANDSDLSARGSTKRRHTPAATSGSRSEDDDDLPLLPQRRRARGESLPMSLPNMMPRLGRGSSSTSRAIKPEASPARSGSTDELSASPALLTAPDRGTRSSRRSMRSTGIKPTTVASTNLRVEAPAAPGLFTGMVFAVSFQSKGHDEVSTESAKNKKKSLEGRIQQAGGRILPDGFEDIFQPPPTAAGTNSISTSSRSRAALDTVCKGSSDELQLLPSAADSGFTALIVDGHSRKAKYLQALALGLPCLAPRWVTACLDRGEIVDWAPYLLCAGESAYLGGVVRSRNLAPYDAAAVRLADVVKRRKLLLDGLAILVVPGRASKETTFLAHVLGAQLSHAQSVQEAREHLKAMEDAGRPFDWVYTGQEKEVAGLFGDRIRPAAKKRKRAPSGDDIERGASPVKTLGVERLIQSLIFGELIEEDDFSGPART
ncbi:chromatin-binding protein RAD9 [Sporothrix schenckii 1099-18]|uniref:BRCT domain-containing protein n=1 Tax=Sporothrix schenckii 1099-18 TaxID=1397361 RepID=A0A0F2LYZ5_SPOSC|nr:chromatin-binding protein RAD9 [Sporothrix schenckii 1099-18]KJR81111.1 hypothetical protein SPSK_04908 [Sporothrix schenckii 1099-18]